MNIRLNQKYKTLEKRVAALEKNIQEQPKVTNISISMPNTKSLAEIVTETKKNLYQFALSL